VNRWKLENKVKKTELRKEVVRIGKGEERKEWERKEWERIRKERMGKDRIG